MELLKTTITGLFFGTFGTMLGGIIGICFKNTSKRFLSSILALASGLMTAVACFDLIPEAMEIAGISSVLLGILSGIVGMAICDILVDKKFKKKENTMQTRKICALENRNYCKYWACLAQYSRRSSNRFWF